MPPKKKRSQQKQAAQSERTTGPLATETAELAQPPPVQQVIQQLGQLSVSSTPRFRISKSEIPALLTEQFMSATYFELRIVSSIMENLMNGFFLKNEKIP
uniref:Uncharacterized protein n=1 Tax=Romanomermis culicivorax TaxID=13658 RepID=A0A915HNC5_ROMCU